MERAIEAFAAMNFLVIGLSHLVQHRAWGEFFALLRSHGRPGAFANGFLSLFMGSLIVAFHNVWTGIPALLTVLGWLMVIKSLVIFLSPDWGARPMGLVQPGKTRGFAATGFIMIGISLALGYGVWHG